MVDLHCHILPGVDDGAQNMEQSLAMARIAWEGGTKLIVATPHCGLPGQPGNFWCPPLAERFRDFRRALREAEIPVQILPGMEFFGGEDLGDLLRQGKLMPLGGSRYLLVEFYFDESATYMENVLEQAAAGGLIPVVAHPERYRAIQRAPERIADWFGRGYIIQANKGSILGDLEPGAEETVWELLEHGLIHVVASDAHSHLRRTPDLSRVRRHLERALGERYTSLLLRENPARIAADREILRELPD